MFLHSTLAPSSVTNLTPVPVNSSAIRITWQPPIHPNGNVTYRVMVSSVTGDIVTTATSVVVGDLQIYSLYYVTVTAENTAGTNRSDEFSVRTGESGECLMIIHALY